MIFEKTRNFNYKFIGSSSGKNGNEAIKRAKMRGVAYIKSTGIYITIPASQFTKYQLNPVKTKGKMGIVTNWKKAR
jgi:hypothetical protein